jgi:hypothetical protein
LAVTAYYEPGAGEFLYHSAIWSKETYLRDFKDQAAANCKPNKTHVVLLKNGEWADFWF